MLRPSLRPNPQTARTSVPAVARALGPIIGTQYRSIQRLCKLLHQHHAKQGTVRSSSLRNTDISQRGDCGKNIQQSVRIRAMGHSHKPPIFAYPQCSTGKYRNTTIYNTVSYFVSAMSAKVLLTWHRSGPRWLYHPDKHQRGWHTSAHRHAVPVQVQQKHNLHCVSHQDDNLLHQRSTNLPLRKAHIPQDGCSTMIISNGTARSQARTLTDSPLACRWPAIQESTSIHTPPL